MTYNRPNDQPSDLMFTACKRIISSTLCYSRWSQTAADYRPPRRSRDGLTQASSVEQKCQLRETLCCYKLPLFFPLGWQCLILASSCSMNRNQNNMLAVLLLMSCIFMTYSLCSSEMKPAIDVWKLFLAILLLCLRLRTSQDMYYFNLTLN